MEYRKSIEAVHKIFPTQGSHPILVTCDDLKDWVCKYDHSVSNLFNEYIASCFLELWKINTPPISFVTVEEEHIPDALRNTLQPRFFKKHCFGSQYLEHAKEMDHSFVAMRGHNYDISKFAMKSDFLKIGLFDIWMCNEDRNYNNFNLLINPQADGKYHFYAIDHTACFNTGNLHREIALLTQDDSILTTPHANVLFNKGRNLNKRVDEIIDDYYLCTNACRERVDHFIDEIPETWSLDKQTLRTQLNQIFEKEWLHQCEQLFRQYVQLGIR